MDRVQVLTLAFVFLGAVIGTCIHEFGHALAAFKGGDTTVRDKGYLTMNPIKYAHPLLSIGFPLLFLAMGGIPLPGGAVYIDTSRLRNRYWESLVSAAGPAGTAVFTLLLSVPFILGLAPDAGEAGLLWKVLAFLIWVELAAFFLNLLPIPPLDGFGIIAPHLPRDMKAAITSIGSFGIFALFILFWRVDAANALLWTLVIRVSSFLGVDPELGLEGLRMLPFGR